MWLGIGMFVSGTVGLIYALPRMPGPLDAGARGWVPYTTSFLVWFGGGTILFVFGAFR